MAASRHHFLQLIRAPKCPTANCIFSMSSYSLFFAAALAHLFAVISPGPDFAVVSRQTLAHGRVAGIRTAWGIATGIVVHVAYALFGLGWLLQKWPALLTILAVMGAVFLAYMGIQALTSSASAPVPQRSPKAAAHDFSVGFITNVLNPKATLFFIGLCASLLSTPTPTSLKLGLAAWIILSTGAWFSLVALLLGSPLLQKPLQRYGHWLDRILGVILLALAAGVLWSVRTSLF